MPRTTRPLYVYRPLLNAEEVIEWAKAVGFPTTMPAESMHVTIAYSKEPVDWTRLVPAAGELVVPASPTRNVMALGDEGAVVLAFSAEALARRHQEIRAAGASWDHEGFRPHVTISWRGLEGDPKEIPPYDGPLVFGPEQFEVIDGGFDPSEIKEARMDKIFKGEVRKVDEHGIAFGWAIVCKENGEPYFDTQDDHIPEDAMLKAAVEFMRDARAAKIMHEGESVGSVLFAMPLTDDIKKAMGLEGGISGLAIGWAPEDKSVMEKFRSGEFTGFSIGGRVREATEA